MFRTHTHTHTHARHTPSLIQTHIKCVSKYSYFQYFTGGVPHIITAPGKFIGEVVIVDVGDVITCASQGCPMATYTWYNGKTYDVIEGPLLNVTNTMVRYTKCMNYHHLSL